VRTNSDLGPKNNKKAPGEYPYANPYQWRMYQREMLRRKDTEAHRIVCTRAAQQVQRHNQEIRKKALERLGGKCVRCGFSDIRALQIDHVNGGGAKELQTIGSYGIMFRILKGNTSDYQLLCANCNWIKRVEKKEVRNGGKKSHEESTKALDDEKTLRVFTRKS